MLEANAHGAVICCAPFLNRGADRLAERVTARPAGERGRAILGPHRGIVVEAQPFAQPDGPGQAIVGDAMPLRHLRCDTQIVSQTKECVVHRPAVIFRDRGGGPDWVERCEVGLRNEAQRARPDILGE